MIAVSGVVRRIRYAWEQTKLGDSSHGLFLNQTDMFTRFVVWIGNMLQYPFSRLHTKGESLTTNPVSAGFAVVLMYPLVLIVAAWTCGVLLPGANNVEMALAEDYAQIGLMVILPFLVA